MDRWDKALIVRGLKLLDHDLAMSATDPRKIDVDLDWIADEREQIAELIEMLEQDIIREAANEAAFTPQERGESDGT